jgi:hypothetical protein
MVIMSVAFAWAFNWNEYKQQAPPGAPHTNVFWPILDSLNYCLSLFPFPFRSFPISILLFPSLPRPFPPRTRTFANFSRFTGDFIVEGYRGVVFLIDYIRGKEGTHAGKKQRLNNAGGKTLDDRRNTEYGLDMDAPFAGVEKTRHGEDGDWHGSDESRVHLSSPKQGSQAVFGSPATTYGGGRASESDDPHGHHATGGRDGAGIEYRAPQQSQVPVYGGVTSEGSTSPNYPPPSGASRTFEEGAYEMQEQGQGGRRY